MPAGRRKRKERGQENSSPPAPALKADDAAAASLAISEMLSLLSPLSGPRHPLEGPLQMCRRLGNIKPGQQSAFPGRPRHAAPLPTGSALNTRGLAKDGSVLLGARVSPASGLSGGAAAQRSRRRHVRTRPRAGVGAGRGAPPPPGTRHAASVPSSASQPSTGELASLSQRRCFIFATRKGPKSKTERP